MLTVTYAADFTFRVAGMFFPDYHPVERSIWAGWMSERESKLGLLTMVALGAAVYAFVAFDIIIAVAALPVILVVYLACASLGARLLGLTISDKKSRELAAHIRVHSAALSRNLRQAVRTNDYGRVEADDREDVVREFLDSVELSFNPQRCEPAAIQFVLAEIERLDAQSRAGGFDAEDYPSDPAEFEHWCAAMLRQHGWTADVTQRGYDQGIDIVARKGALFIGLQVKRYSTPVGNRAIQEAFTGMGYYGLNGAGVLATSGFTPSARRLAGSTGIALLSTHDIPGLEQAFRRTIAPAAE